MTIAFNLLLHALLVSALVLFVLAIIRVALETSDTVERVLRVAALFAGAMVTLGAQQAGVDYADFVVEALAGARGASAVANVGATIIPALLGVGLGFYVVRTLKVNETIAVRVLAFVGMLATTAFLQVYAAAVSAEGLELGAAALPNILFTAGVILTVVFTYDKSKVHGGGESGLGGLFQRGRERLAARGISPTVPPQPTGSTFPTAPRQDRPTSKQPFETL
jgi:hypothetical protein